MPCYCGGHFCILFVSLRVSVKFYFVFDLQLTRAKPTMPCCCGGQICILFVSFSVSVNFISVLTCNSLEPSPQCHVIVVVIFVFYLLVSVFQSNLFQFWPAAHWSQAHNAMLLWWSYLYFICEFQCFSQIYFSFDMQLTRAKPTMPCYCGGHICILFVSFSVSVKFISVLTCNSLEPSPQCHVIVVVIFVFYL